MQFQFNTRRSYSPHGQRIVAKVEDHGVIFNDLDRGISGAVGNSQMEYGSLRGWDRASRSDTKQLLMWCYDHGHYEESDKASGLKWELGYES